VRAALTSGSAKTQHSSFARATLPHTMRQQLCGACATRTVGCRGVAVAHAAVHCCHRYGDDLDVSVNIAAVADYLEACARAQAAEPPSPQPDHSLRHLVRAVTP
jgi:hypothetical protein